MKSTTQTAQYRPETAEEEYVQETIKALPSIGYAEDDLRAQLEGTARSGIQHITDILEHQYKKKCDSAVVPKAFWRPARAQAFLIYMRICQRLIRSLRETAANPDKKF
jgi:hypothetical protein